MTAKEAFQEIITYWRDTVYPRMNAVTQDATDEQILALAEDLRKVSNGEGVDGKTFPSIGTIDGNSVAGTTGTQIDCVNKQSFFGPCAAKFRILSSLLIHHATKRYDVIGNMHRVVQTWFPDLDYNDKTKVIEAVQALKDEAFGTGGLFDQLLVMADTGTWKV